MATAEELLAAAGATEEILVVNPDTRVISIPATIKILGVESDDDVKRLYFEVPRYYGEFDLSTFETRINYKNARGGGDIYMVDDLAISDDKQNITFSWLVDRFALNYSGDVDFSICMRLLDEDNVVIKEWNTTYASLPVLKGLETEKAVVDQNPTAFNQLLCRLYAIEAATGNGQNGYYTVIRVDEDDAGVEFTIINQDGETVATVKNGVTYTPDYNYAEGVIYWTNDRGMPNPDPMYVKGDRGEKGDKGEKGDPGKDGQLSSVLYVNSPFKVYDYPRNTDRETYYPNNAPVGTHKYTEILPCPKYLGWKITGSATLVLYIGTVDSSGKFTRDATYDLYTANKETTPINYFDHSRSNLIEVADDHVFYYRISTPTDADTVTIIGGNNLFDGVMDDIAVIPNYVRQSGNDWVTTLGVDCYGIVLPTDSYYMILRKDVQAASISKAATNLADIKVSYEDPDGTIHVSEATPFGYIPANAGVAQITVPKDCSLNDLVICTSKPVKSNNTSGKRRLVKEIGRDAITKFTFVGKQNVGWNDNTKRTMLNRRFYGVPYSSRWMNSHFVGFEVSPETALNAFNDPYSIAYDGGILTDNSGNEINKVEVTGESEVGSRGGVGYGLVCSAFALLMGGNPYPQTNRGFTFDSNFSVNKTTDVNAGMHLINRGMSHVVTVDEVYDNGYALYEATDPCIAQTIHTVENPGYAATQTRMSFLDDYVYSVGYHDIGGYDTNMVNFDVSVTECKVRPWRGHKCVYGPWDKTARGSGICATVDAGVQSFTLSIPADTDKGIAAKTETIAVTETNFADISKYVTASGTYILDAGEKDSGGNAITTKFRYFNHDDVLLNFDKDGKAYFSHDDVEYVYVNVDGFGGEFGKYTASDFGMTEEEFQDDKIGPMVIAKGKYYPDLAKDPSRIVDVRAAIVSDATVNDCWGKYSVPASFGVSEYVDKDEELARAKANAIICEASGEVISVNDASNDRLRGLKLYGKTTHVTTTGAQLLNYKAWENAYVYNGTGVYENNGITITATANDAFTMHGVDTFPVDARIPVSEGETITISWEETTNTSGLVYIFPNGENSGMIYVSNATEKFINYTATSGITFITFRFGVETSGKTIAYKNIMVNKGNTAKLYEPYTGGMPGPNPDYPQELNSVTKPTVKILGKNLLDESQLVHHPEYTDMYSSALSVLNYNVRKGETYTISFDTENTGVHMCVNPNSGFTYAQFTMDGKRHSFTATMSKDVDSGTSNIPLVSIETTTSSPCGSFSNVQIELGSTATEYEPYKEQSINIPRSIPGIPVTSGGNYTDSDGQQWICDEVDFERGVYVQRLAHYVFDGSEDEEWGGIFTHGNSSASYVRISVERSRDQYTVPMFCNYAKHGTWGKDVICFVNNYDEFMIGGAFPEGVLDDLDAFKAYIAEHPVELTYILETPIETPLSAAELNAFKALTTNYPNTAILNDSGAWMDVKYNADVKTWVMKYVAQMLNQGA